MFFHGKLRTRGHICGNRNLLRLARRRSLSGSARRYDAPAVSVCSRALRDLSSRQYTMLLRRIRLSAAQQQRRVVEPDPTNPGYPREDAKWLEKALRFSDRLQPWMRRLGRRKLARAADWKPGVSVVVPQLEWSAGTVDHCVQGLLRTAREMPEPFEVIVLTSNSEPGIARSAGIFPVRWLRTIPGRGLAGDVKRALRAARFDWIYLLDAGMLVEPRTLAEALRWRALR